MISLSSCAYFSARSLTGDVAGKRREIIPKGWHYYSEKTSMDYKPRRGDISCVSCMLVEELRS